MAAGPQIGVIGCIPAMELVCFFSVGFSFGFYFPPFVGLFCSGGAMSEKEYSEMQIRETAERLGIINPGVVDELIAALNKPKWEPATDEVYAYPKSVSLNGFGYSKRSPELGGDTDWVDGVRPLNRDELGPKVGKLLALFPELIEYSVGGDPMPPEYVVEAEQAWQDWLDTQGGE